MITPGTTELMTCGSVGDESMTTEDDTVIYAISDLHIGGDEQLEEVTFLDELLDFLTELEHTDEEAELIINGDAFGLWEFTTLEGLEKFDHLEVTYPELFEQLRATGENIEITLLPGNHDHELAAYDGYVERFAEYNVTLLPEQSITRELGDHVIWFEHGHQQDPNNHIEAFGNPHATPLGYYYNTHVTSRAGHLSERGRARYDWLKDVQAVTPTEMMPRWLVSKYFYREMNPFLRYAVVPFFVLFNISALLAILVGLDLANVITLPRGILIDVLGQFGIAGTAAYFALGLNIAIAGILLLLGIPLYILVRDIRITLDRFGILEEDITIDPSQPYVEAAREVVQSEPHASVFCYGHTHRPKTKKIDGGVLVNTGTWLKRLHRREVVGRLLPAVFYPSYQLCAVRMTTEGSDLVIDFEAIEKPSPLTEELTRTERFLALGREPRPELPDRTIVTDE